MKNATAAQVREWAASTGRTVGKRGRVTHLTAEFNKAHKGKFVYVPQSDAEKRHTTIPGVVSVDKAGRKVTKSVTIPTEQARSLIASSQGKRGRLSLSTVALALSAQNADAVADQFTKSV